NMRNFLIYLGFAIASIAISATFVTSQSYIQLGVAVVLYSLLVFTAYKLFLKKKKKPAVAIVPQSSEQTQSTQEETVHIQKEVGITDTDKRDFLKMIGAAGISFFLFSIFNRRTGSMFFQEPEKLGSTSLEDASGNKIDPAVCQPTDSYIISEIDESYVSFYGFINKEGGWYIMKEDPDVGSFRYTKGETDFTTNWAEREKLNYDYYHNIF
ncbi:hypothetical protein ACFL25_01040, partial [Patescibacteria group bacterium]